MTGRQQHGHHGHFRSRVGSHSERRPSQYNGTHPRLQALIDEWSVRERPTLEIQDVSSMLVDGRVSDILTIKEGKDMEVVSVVFPWFIATVRTTIDIRLYELKSTLFEKLKRMSVPDYSFVPSDYVFRYINDSAEMECVFNEEIPLYKLELTNPFPMIFLHEPDGLNHDKELCKDISHCLGFPLESLEEVLDDELRQFRSWLFSNTKEACMNRGTEGYKHYAFPEETVLSVEQVCPQHLITKIRLSKLQYKFYYQTRQAEEERDTTNVLALVIDFNPDYTPKSITEALLEQIREKDIADPNDPEDEEFLIQLAGQKSFLTNDENLLVTYKSVRSAFENHRPPAFVVRRKSLVMRDYPKPKNLHVPTYVKAQERKIDLDGLSISIENTPRGTRDDDDDDLVMSDFRSAALLCLWDIDANLSLRAVQLNNCNFDDPSGQITVEFKVYCGQTVLVEKMSPSVRCSHPIWPRQFIESDLYMKDMPPSAVLGVRVLFSKNMKKKSDYIEIGWVNISLTDWRDQLRQGEFPLQLWPPDKSANRSRIGENGAKIGLKCQLVVEIKHFEARVKMPSHKQYECLVEERYKWSEREVTVPENYTPKANDKDHGKLIEIISFFESGGKLSEEDEKYVWRWRKYISQHMPDSITVISEMSMIWKQRERFSELYVMLSNWQNLTVGAALTLLGKRCTDRVLRKFAVEQLDSLLDVNTFPLFILPLIQALKYEPRAESDVVRMLLRKALSDYRVGHKLFWLLRAEIAGLRDVQAKSEEFRRIALLIEAYLRGNEDHIKTVVRQVDMVELLSKLSVMVKTYPKDIATKRLREELRNEYVKLENMDSPLDPTYMLGTLLIDRCKVLGSAKMPLRLSWSNSNMMGELHLPIYEIIFKNGDDLRQDMLVLQVLEVMDNIWKNNQLDCCLSPYPVLPMGTKIGIIGVVSNCATIFEIQSDGGKVGAAVKSLETTFLNKFIRQHAGDSKEYLECADRFMWSCVGYSVATFIMGIKDRHSDNIMITYDGKIFHIDFGHILGHGKTKLGIQRDRQPFVLTEHFLCVMRKGKPVDKDAHEVVKFRQLCKEAYILLWEQRNLFESLFTLMQGMELPELSTTADLDHIKKTLCVGTEKREEAEKYFSDVFEEAFNGSWSTKTNWFFHAVKHL